jgi:transcriptional regulator with XRE-family HTH domain
MSQLDLANASTVSQRHISFLESGRALPGLEVVAKLSKALDLTFSDANLLYEALGFKAPRPAFVWDDAGFSASRAAIEAMMANHAPFPAIATLRCGTILMANKAYQTLIDWAFNQATSVRAPEIVFNNLFDLTLHPKGLMQFMDNPEEIIPHTFRRLRSAAAANPAAAAVLGKVERRTALQPFAELHDRGESLQASVLIERYLVGLEMISVVSMVASFGSPEDVTTQEIQIELFFPASEETTAFFERVHSAPPT